MLDRGGRLSRFKERFKGFVKLGVRPGLPPSSFDGRALRALLRMWAISTAEL
jgi:hypothetical protein